MTPPPESDPLPRPDRFSLTVQVVGTMLAVVLFALALTTLLNALRFEETLENLVEQRLDVVAQEVASDVVVGLDLGLRIESMENLQGIIDRLIGQVGGVAAVSIHDCDGKPIAVTQGTVATARVADATFLASVLAPGAASWRRFEPQGIALGIMVTNSYGQCAGGVALEYEADTFFRTRDAVVQRLIWIALGAVLLTLPAALFLVSLFRRRDRILARIRADLDGLSVGSSVGTGPALPIHALEQADSGERALIDGYHAARPALLELAAHAPTDRGSVSPAVAERPVWGRRVLHWWADPVVRVLALTAATLLLALMLVSVLTAGTLRNTLLPELAHKGMAEGVQAARVVQRAVDLAIPLPELVGVDDFFVGLQRNDADLAFFAISDAAGRILHVAGRSADEVRTILDAPPQREAALSNSGQSRQAGYLVTRLVLDDASASASAVLHLGHDESALTRPLKESVADLLIVLMVSLFLAFEIMLLVVTINVTLPLRATLRVLGEIATRRFAMMHGEFARGELGAIAHRLNTMVQRGGARLHVRPIRIRDPRLVGVRLLAFLFVFAEELARPIMPVFFGQLASGGEAGSHMGAGVVMALHMAVVAIAMPVGSMFYARIGRRRMYVIGAVLASIGLLGTGLADNLWQLLIFRALSGLGYAATFVACQGFVIESTDGTNRARGSALMVGGIMLADICGPAIGGILAAWIGHDTTFMLGAGVAALAALLVTRLMGQVTDHQDQPPRVTLRTFSELLANRRFVALLLFGAVPAKLVLGGLLYYLVPLALLEFGANAAQTGRIIMLYGLAGLLCGPLFAYLTDRYQRPVVALAVGGVLTAAGAIPLTTASSDAAVALAVVALGVGQAISIPALVAAALGLSRHAVTVHGQGPVMAVLRLLERLGGAAGPLLAAALSASLGVTAAMGLFGYYALVSVLLLLLALSVLSRLDGARAPSSAGRDGEP